MQAMGQAAAASSGKMFGWIFSSMRIHEWCINCTLTRFIELCRCVGECMEHEASKWGALAAKYKYYILRWSEHLCIICLFLCSQIAFVENFWIIMCSWMPSLVHGHIQVAFVFDRSQTVSSHARQERRQIYSKYDWLWRMHLQRAYGPAGHL